MGDEPIKTAFHDSHAAMGASFEADGGWLWTASFGDGAKEYDAVRNGCGVWDVSPLNKWDFSGSDAGKAAQKINTNDVLGLSPGRVRYGGFVDDDGLLVDDGTVYKLSDDHYWVMTNLSDHTEWFAQTLKGLDVNVDYRALQMPHLGLQGPKSGEVLSKMTDVDFAALKYFQFIPEQVKVGGVDVWLSRTGFGGEKGYELFTSPENAAQLWQSVLDAGAMPFGIDAIEICRIEAGLVVTDYDYEGHQRSPYDFSMDRLVAIDKPVDFNGKAKLEEIAKNPPNRFKTLKIDGDILPEYGATVTKDGQEIGVLTSPADSPKFGKIGLAILPTDQANNGKTVDIALEGGGTATGTVAALPIYDTNKERPRA
ncbi:MAG: aminomethyltransferase family protein [Actinomycetota bacterium]